MALKINKLFFILIKTKCFCYTLVINPLLTKLVRFRWLDISLIIFCIFMDLTRSQSIKLQELGQYAAILTLCFVNNPFIYIDFTFWYSLILFERICLLRNLFIQTQVSLRLPLWKILLMLSLQEFSNLMLTIQYIG